jgi:hypothetical protein
MEYCPAKEPSGYSIEWRCPCLAFCGFFECHEKISCCASSLNAPALKALTNQTIKIQTFCE